MPADVTLNSGTGGAIIRTDPTTSSEHVQVIKLTYGDTGTFNMVSTALALPVIVTSSQSTLNVLTSGTLVVTATAAANPWSSAPGFNLPVVSVSSGLVQALGVIAASSGVPSGLAFTNNITTGGVALSVNVKGTPAQWFGYTIFNSTAALRSVKIYNTSSAPTIGSTASLIAYLPVPGSTGGGGANLIFPYGVFASNGLGYTITANAAATDTGAPGTNDVSLTLYYV